MCIKVPNIHLPDPWVVFDEIFTSGVKSDKLCEIKSVEKAPTPPTADAALTE